MPGQYDYSINIPQPPAQNFLQSLLGIQQLKGLQQQQEISQQQAQFAQQQQPLQLQHLQEQINSQKLQQGLLGTQAKAAEFELAQKQDFQNSLNDLSSDPSKWTGDNFMQLGIKFHQADPNLLMNMAKMRASIPTKAQAFGDNLGQQLVLATQIGDTDTGKKLLESGIKTAKDDPDLTKMVPQLQQLSDQYNKFPEKSSAIAAMGLQIFSPDKAKAMFGAIDERLKTEQTQAQIEETKAKTQKLNQEIELGKPLPSSIVKANKEYDDKAEAADKMATQLAQAAESMRALPSVGSVKEWWTNIKPHLGFGENPEIAIRNNAAQLAGLGMLGAENKAIGGVIRSNQMFQYATSRIPDTWSAPQELAKRLDAQAETQKNIAQIMKVDSEWNSAFRGSAKATKPEQIMGMDVAPGTTKNQFKEQMAKQLFPAPEPPKPPAPPAANPIEAELRRRGLLK